MVTSHTIGRVASADPTESQQKMQARVRIFLTNMSDFWDALSSGDFPSGLEGFMDVDWQGRTVVLRGPVGLVGEVLTFLSTAGVLVSSNQ